MLIYYIKSALRSFRKNKASVFINVIGLSSGLASCILLLLWIEKELTFNNFIPESQGVFQVITNYPLNEKTQSARATSFRIIQTLQQGQAGIKELVFVETRENKHVVESNDKRLEFEGKGISSNFFNLISRRFLYGDAKKALPDQLSMVISESMANTLLGSEWRNKISTNTIVLDGRNEFDITGVYEDFPTNSTIQFDFGLLLTEDYQEHIGIYNYEAYIALSDPAQAETVANHINGQLKKMTAATVLLQPFDDIYLYSDLLDGKVNGGRIEYVHLFIGASLLILLMACINFMNLYTAGAFKRTKEIGTKRVIGAERTSLIWQFLIESFSITVISGCIAIVMLAVTLPYINTALSENISLPYTSPVFWITVIGIILLTGGISGIYPAYILTSFKVISMLNVNQNVKIGGNLMRKTLFCFQFFLSILLIVFTTGVINQVSYLKEKDLGYEKKNILVKELTQADLEKLDVMKQKLKQQSSIEGVTFCSDNLFAGSPMVGGIVWPDKPAHDSTSFGVIFVDEDFVDVLKIQKVEGFAKKAASNAGVPIFINESARKIMGDNILHQPIQVWGGEGEVIGVVKDFHFNSLFTPIQPLVVAIMPKEAEYIIMRVQPDHYQDALHALQEIHIANNPSEIFSYYAFDSTLDRLYQNETNMGKISTLFSFLSIVIAALGLFGLANFTVERRTRELSIRKVFGANFSRLLALLVGDFSKLILLAIVLAIPVAYYLLEAWMMKFSYRHMISWLEFMAPVFLLILVAFATILFHAIRVNYIDPVVTLKEK
ncbi:ABC transporter permease [Ohtaekwangia koreensis]|uniref:ABC-type transport system, involved in lipoprotein release, permease component n=1 Tax=Ohtaekwangia koreensis TaxID=688867 RepID=A0A1T5M4Z1_9BACT|nr:ABC transporter permease [Ohtaekwangia koreensis]SKC83317.1 ABC-type transport system, involved in lipoprotein release, permease component [Ohtaekwangia koreensis]